MDNILAFSAVIVIVLTLAVALGVAAKIGMAIERKFRRRGATRIQRWPDNRTERMFGYTASLADKIAHCLRTPTGQTRHYTHDPKFIPEHLRSPNRLLLKQAD
jgi:hypothetical protein